MPRELHNHMYSGRTTVEDQHRHRFMGTTSENPDVLGHTHLMAGSTDFRQGHRHYYRIITGPPIPYGNGHLHYFYGMTSVSDRHTHYMVGYTRVHRHGGYGMGHGEYGTEAE